MGRPLQAPLGQVITVLPVTARGEQAPDVMRWERQQPGGSSPNPQPQSDCEKNTRATQIDRGTFYKTPSEPPRS